MITYKKHAASVALVMLFAVSLLVSVPTSCAVFRQSITDLSAPSSVEAGEAFPVSIRVHYDFTGEGEVTIFARVRDASTGGSVAIGSGGNRQVHGVGDGTWDFQAVARNTPGLWRLEAYVIRQKGAQEVEDDREGFTVTVREPAASFDFALRFDPSVVAMWQGQYALADVYVATVSGQPQEVTLTYTIPPVPGISGTLSRTKGIPLFTSTLRIETTTQTPPGTYTVNVGGVAGAVTRVASVTVKVESAQPPPGFDFDIRVDPSAVSLKPGDSALCGISVGLVTGPAQEVSLMYTIPPVTGVSASISTAKGTPPFNLMLKMSTTPQTPPGTYTINVVGSSGSLQRTATVTLTVTAAGGFDFSVTASPDSVSLRPGESASSKVSTRLVTGPAQEVSFMYTVPPVVGVGATISPAKGTPPFTSTIRISTTIQTPPGTYMINMAAVGGGVEKRMSITLTVVASGQPPPSGFDFSITVKPDSQSLNPEESMVYDVYVDLTAGTSDTVSLTLTGLPEDATYAFDPPTGLPYFPSKLTVYVPGYTAAGAPMAAGTYTLTVTAEAAGLVRTATTTLVIRASEVTTTQTAQTGTQATLTSTQTTGTKGPLGEALGGGGILLGLLVVVIVGAAVYYVGKRHKAKT